LEGALLGKQASDLGIEEGRVLLECRVELGDLSLHVWHHRVDHIVQTDDAFLALLDFSLQRCDLLRGCGRSLQPSPFGSEDRLWLKISLGLRRFGARLGLELNVGGLEWLEISVCDGCPDLVDDPVSTSIVHL
jgi:hypothetical protein